jgi:hypothetical protein
LQEEKRVEAYYELHGKNFRSQRDVQSDSFGMDD